MSTEVIREFLVSLGFETNETEFKKFNKGIDNATKSAAKLGAELAALATAAAAAVAVVASRFEDLYYATQRLNSSAENIRGVSFAIGQMGGDAKNARASLEGLANFMRSNPGGERFISSLGVATRDANGDLIDTSLMLVEVGKQLKSMPYFMAKQRAGMMGIDEQTLQALLRGDIEKHLDAYGRIAKRVGMDQDQAAEASKNFMNRVRELGAYLTLLAEKYLVILQKPAERFIAIFEKLDEATGGASTALIALGVVLAPLIALVGPVAAGIAAVAAAIILLYDDFMTWREGGDSLINWAQWSDEIDAVMAAFGALWGALKEVWAALVEFGNAIGVNGDFLKTFVEVSLLALSAGLQNLASIIRIIVALLTGQWGKAWDIAGEATKRTLGYWGKLWSKITGEEDGAKEGTGPSARARAAALSKGGAGSNVHQLAGTVTANAQSAMDYFQRAGWTKEQAAGIVANLKKESSLNKNAVGDGGKAFGIAQWHPDRQANFRKWAGKDIRDASFAEQLGFVHYELTGGSEQGAGRRLRQARTAGQAGATVSRYYERPAKVEAEMAERAGIASALYANTRLGVAGGSGGPTAASGQQGGTVVHLNQTTNIKVDGAGDATAAGRAVAGEQDRVNGNLVRNTKGAVR